LFHVEAVTSAALANQQLNACRTLFPECGKIDVAAETSSSSPMVGVAVAVRDAGERELFHELVQPYEKSLYFATFSILQNEQDAEDAAQEAVLKALKNLGNFRAESKFSTWLVSIAVNEARARLRHARVLKFESVDESPPDEEGGGFTPSVISDWREVPLQALERKELRQLLQKAIASLPEIYREVLLLRDVEEFSIAEAAAALEVSEGVVKTRLLRARLMMQKILAPQLASKRSGLFGLFRNRAGGSWF
jgi:RNA polymerase sigma-70 factor (ECF subfamily)